MKNDKIGFGDITMDKVAVDMAINSYEDFLVNQEMKKADLKLKLFIFLSLIPFAVLFGFLIYIS